MNIPKMLPWIAGRAGLGQEHSIRLSQRASAESKTECGNNASADYFARAMQRFRELVQCESCSGRSPHQQGI